MHKCGSNETSVPACEAVAKQAGTSSKVLFRTNPRVILEDIGGGDGGSPTLSLSECESGKSVSDFSSDSESISGVSSDGESDFVCESSEESENESDADFLETKPIPKKVGSRKEGSLRGRNKQPWTQEECKVLWECYVRSGGSGSDGYIKRLVEMWDGRDVNVRPQAALLGQLRSLKSGRRLSEFEKREIERKVTLERLVPAGQGNSVDEGEDIDFVIEENELVIEEVIDPSLNEPLVQTTADIVNSEFPKVCVERLDCVTDEGLLRELIDEEKRVLERIRVIFHSQDRVEIPSLKGVDRGLVSREVGLVNRLLTNMTGSCVDVTSVNKLLYAGSYVVCERLGLMKKRKETLKSKKPWWQRRLEGSIKQWRKDLGRISELIKGVNLKSKVIAELNRRYKLSERGSRSVVVFLENKIRAASTKISFYVDSKLTEHQNKLFKTNQSLLYKQLGGKYNSNSSSEPLDPEQAKAFWQGIWSEESSFNSNNSWLGDYESHLSSERDILPQDDVSISDDDIRAGLKRMSNWKAPGPDGVRGFWFKKFSSLHPFLSKSLQQCLSEGDVPGWMTKGRTVLIQKDPAKGPVAGNYRPIACLPLMWKLLTGTLAGKIYDHLNANALLPTEQKGCRKGSRGTKDQLLIDKAVLREAKIKHRFLSMAWIDYKKAYDMVPHPWILKMLQLTKVAGNVSSFLSNSMKHWETTLSCNGENLGDVAIKRGIFQGDSLSPLLFIVSMLPLTFLLNREKNNVGYRLGNFGDIINHLFFMDDLKLYARSEVGLKQLVDIVYAFSSDIGMRFGIDKCASLRIEAGVKKASEGIELPNGEVISEVEDVGYKYLGVLQECDVKHREMKKLISSEYLKRVKAVARSKLYSNNLFRAFNSWAVSVVRYSAGVVDWRVHELKEMDVKTRKILTMNGIFHKKGNVDRLYLKRCDGGRGLISVEDCVRMEEANLRNHLRKSAESLMISASSVLIGEEECKKECEANFHTEECFLEESGAEYKERILTERTNRVYEKKLHGKFFRDVSGVAPSEELFDWVKCGSVNKSTEGFVFAAQEQALQTNWLKARITGESEDARCRKCKKQDETVAHIVSGCGILAQSDYKTRHDRMGLRVYWELCKKYGVKCSEKWYEECPESVRKSECGKYEIWWNRPVNTPKRLDHNKPDVILIDKDKKVWTIVDFSVPNDKNIVVKEKEKLDHYRDLAKEVRKMFHVKTKVVPIVVGALGVFSKNLDGYLKELDMPYVRRTLQVSAILGSSIILRKVLNM